MLSRVPITSEMVQVPALIKSWALPSHTSVPWDRPEICSKSENLVGWDSSSMPRTKLVPSSGRERVPVLMPPKSSSVTPKAAGELNSDMTSGSLMETSITEMPV